jgi:hypothetical protein
MPNAMLCEIVPLASDFPAVAYVPTAGKRSGDYSAYLGLVLTDPLTGFPFPGNIIPPNRLGSIWVWRVP